MLQNMYTLLIQDVLVNRKKYANACKSQPYLCDNELWARKEYKLVPDEWVWGQ
jgi:hypothetical protein